MKRKIYLQLLAEATETDAKENTSKKDADNHEADNPEDNDRNEKKYTDADVDKMFNKKFAEWQKKKDKEIDEAKKLAEMSEKEKADYQTEQIQKELDKYKQKEALAEMVKTARGMLKEKNVSVSDEVVSMLVNTDAQQTKAAVDEFAKAFLEAVENEVKNRLKGTSPKKGTAGGSDTMTKEQIMSIRDTELRQKKMLEHKELFGL